MAKPLHNNEKIERLHKMKSWPQVLGVTAANMFHMSSMVGIGFSSPTLDEVTIEHKLSDNQKALFASILVIGQIMGCLFGGPLADRLGRRLAIIVCGLGSSVGWCLIALSPSAALLFAGRFLNGFCDSMGIPIAIAFVSEISHRSNVGIFMNSASISAAAGIPFVYIVGSVLPFRIAAFVCLLVPALGAAIAIFVPESPVFLLSRARLDCSEASLKWYRGVKTDDDDDESFNFKHEMKSMEADFSGRTNDHVFSHLNSPDTLRPFVILLSLFILFPMTGIFSIIFFAVELLRSMNIGSVTLIAVLISIIRVGGVVVSSVFINKIGRRKLLMVSVAVATISTEFIAASIFAQSYLDIPQGSAASIALTVLLNAGLIFYMFFNGLGVSPLPWTLLGEWFPPQTKAVCSSFITMSFFLSTLASVQVTTFLQDTMGTAGMFFVFGGASLLFGTISAVFVPETNGRTYRDSVLRRDNLDSDPELKV